MGAHKGSISYATFFATADPAGGWRKLYPTAMSRACFEALDLDEEQCSGWVNPLAALDVDLTLGKVLRGGQYFCATLRVDRWSIAKAIIDAHIEAACEKHRREAVVTRVGARARAALKETVTRELREAALPQMNLIESVWDFDRRVVRVWTHSKTALELFAIQFEGAFGVNLIPNSPYTAAMHLDLSDDILEALGGELTPWNAAGAAEAEALSEGFNESGYTATLSINGGPEVDLDKVLNIGSPKRKPSTPDLLVMIESTRFIGCEFLTWLWFIAERIGSEKIAGGAEVELWIADKLTLEGGLKDIGSKVTLSGTSPAESAEARAALCQGKVVEVARITLSRDGREWTFTATARTLALSSVKIPAVLSSGDDALAERMTLIEELDEIWFGLYRNFLTIRLGAEWAPEAWLMRKWAHRPPEPDREPAATLPGMAGGEP